MTGSVLAKDSLSAGRVGIFWFYKNHLLARTQPLSQAEKRGTKLDSALAHVEQWPGLVQQHRSDIPMLRILEYDEVPRGRVLFDVANQRFLVYMDETLFSDHEARLKPCGEVSAALRQAFQLDGHRVGYNTDPHYRLGGWEEETPSV